MLYERFFFLFGLRVAGLRERILKACTTPSCTAQNQRIKPFFEQRSEPASALKLTYKSTIRFYIDNGCIAAAQSNAFKRLPRAAQQQPTATERGTSRALSHWRGQMGPLDGTKGKVEPSTKFGSAFQCRSPSPMKELFLICCAMERSKFQSFALIMSVDRKFILNISLDEFSVIFGIWQIGSLRRAHGSPIFGERRATRRRHRFELDGVL